MDAPRLVGIEIGGTKLQLGFGPGDGHIEALERRAVAPERGAAAIRDQIVEAFGGLRDRFGPIAAVGIGFGGPVDAGRGRVVVSNQVAGWESFDLAGWAREVLGVPT